MERWHGEGEGEGRRTWLRRAKPGAELWRVRTQTCDHPQKTGHGGAAVWPPWVAGHLSMRKPGVWGLFNGNPGHTAEGTSPLHLSPHRGPLPRDQDHTAYLERQRVGETDCLGPTGYPFPGAPSLSPHWEAREEGGRRGELCLDTPSAASRS